MDAIEPALFVTSLATDRYGTGELMDAHDAGPFDVEAHWAILPEMVIHSQSTEAIAPALPRAPLIASNEPGLESCSGKSVKIYDWR